jgi:hypothetical protein
MRIEGRIIVRVLTRSPNVVLQLCRHTQEAVLFFFWMGVPLKAPFACTRCHNFPLFFTFSTPNTNMSAKQGFDEFMNVVIDEAVEVYVKEAKPRRELGA